MDEQTLEAFTRTRNTIKDPEMEYVCVHDAALILAEYDRFVG